MSGRSLRERFVALQIKLALLGRMAKEVLAALFRRKP